MRAPAGGRRSLEDMLTALSRHGVRLAPERTLEDLTSEWSRREIEAQGFEMALVALGGDLIDPESFDVVAPLSNDVWHFDPESIRVPGDYASIARRVQLLAAGVLDLEPVTDHVDIKEGSAWVEWMEAGHLVRRELLVDGFSVDFAIFAFLNDALESRGSTRRLFVANLEQDVLIVCCDEPRRAALSKLTGLKFGPHV